MASMPPRAKHKDRQARPLIAARRSGAADGDGLAFERAPQSAQSSTHLGPANSNQLAGRALKAIERKIRRLIDDIEDQRDLAIIMRRTRRIRTSLQDLQRQLIECERTRCIEEATNLKSSSEIIERLKAFGDLVRRYGE